MNIQDDALTKKLTKEQLAVLRDKGTEAPFSGEFFKHNAAGVYTCAACGMELFTSEQKYDSDQPGLEGWPSFADVAGSDAVRFEDDDRYGMHRIEVVCKTCGGHLGHVFPDDSSPTGQHYCINSVSLGFSPKDNPDEAHSV